MRSENRGAKKEEPFVYASTVKKYWLFLDVTRVIV